MLEQGTGTTLPGCRWPTSRPLRDGRPILAPAGWAGQSASLGAAPYATDRRGALDHGACPGRLGERRGVTRAAAGGPTRGNGPAYSRAAKRGGHGPGSGCGSPREVPLSRSPATTRASPAAIADGGAGRPAPAGGPGQGRRDPRTTPRRHAGPRGDARQRGGAIRPVQLASLGTPSVVARTCCWPRGGRQRGYCGGRARGSARKSSLPWMIGQSITSTPGGWSGFCPWPCGVDLDGDRDQRANRTVAGCHPPRVSLELRVSRCLPSWRPPGAGLAHARRGGDRAERAATQNRF